jgi:hypothetical protein
LQYATLIFIITNELLLRIFFFFFFFFFRNPRIFFAPEAFAPASALSSLEATLFELHEPAMEAAAPERQETAGGQPEPTSEASQPVRSDDGLGRWPPKLCGLCSSPACADRDGIWMEDGPVRYLCLAHDLAYMSGDLAVFPPESFPQTSACHGFAFGTATLRTREPTLNLVAAEALAVLQGAPKAPHQDATLRYY